MDAPAFMVFVEDTETSTVVTRKYIYIHTCCFIIINNKIFNFITEFVLFYANVFQNIAKPYYKNPKNMHKNATVYKSRNGSLALNETGTGCFT